MDEGRFLFVQIAWLVDEIVEAICIGHILNVVHNCD